jgi:flagellin-like hook-associated protein FlgL
MAQLPVSPAKAGNSAEAAASQVIAKAQTEDANLSNAQLVRTRMSTLVQQAGDSATTATDCDAINQELSSLKGELKTISVSANNDALSKSYAGGNGASYSLVGAAGSRDISISASTTAEDYAGMLTALNGARDGVSAAQAGNSVTMTTACKDHTDSLVNSAKSSGLDA